MKEYDLMEHARSIVRSGKLKPGLKYLMSASILQRNLRIGFKQAEYVLAKLLEEGLIDNKNW